MRAPDDVFLDPLVNLSVDFLCVGVWVFLTLLPTLMVNTKRRDEPLTPRDYTGWLLWTTGFLMESIADYQKSSFRADQNNQVRI